MVWDRNMMQSVDAYRSSSMLYTVARGSLDREQQCCNEEDIDYYLYHMLSDKLICVK